MNMENKTNKSNVLTSQIIIFSFIILFELLALMGLLVAPLVVYGKFVFMGSRFLILSFPIFLFSPLVYGLFKLKKWSYYYGLVIISVTILNTIFHIGSGIFSLQRNSSQVFPALGGLIYATIAINIFVLIFFLVTLFLQLKLKQELTK